MRPQNLQTKRYVDRIRSPLRRRDEIPHRQTGESRFTNARSLLQPVSFQRLEKLPARSDLGSHGIRRIQHRSDRVGTNVRKPRFQRVL